MLKNKKTKQENDREEQMIGEESRGQMRAET
jgi:hypothetical protein